LVALDLADIAETVLVTIRRSKTDQDGEGTSLSHPLQIATLSAGLGDGRVGITFCPGKCNRSAHTGAWERDLAVDLDAIQNWGASAVVTLVEHKELIFLKVPNLGEEVSRRGNPVPLQVGTNRRT
jgi:hypothetical protein